MQHSDILYAFYIYGSIVRMRRYVTYWEGESTPFGTTFTSPAFVIAEKNSPPYAKKIGVVWREGAASPYTIKFEGISGWRLNIREEAIYTLNIRDIDITHSDVTHSDTHSDLAHGDGAHSDKAHSDTHANYYDHGNSYSDTSPSNVPHSDSHSDSWKTHDDYWVGPGHDDYWAGAHSDKAHSDIAHSDIAHSDYHADYSHSDSHTDIAHSDSAHADSAHSDTLHSDLGSQWSNLAIRAHRP
jgi:hypothetical protein